MADLLKFIRGQKKQEPERGKRPPPNPEPNYTPEPLDPTNHAD